MDRFSRLLFRLPMGGEQPCAVLPKELRLAATSLRASDSRDSAVSLCGAESRGRSGASQLALATT